MCSMIGIAAQSLSQVCSSSHITFSRLIQFGSLDSLKVSRLGVNKHFVNRRNRQIVNQAQIYAHAHVG